MRAGWPHYRGDFVQYRCVHGDHITGVILCSTEACMVATFQGRLVRYRVGNVYYQPSLCAYTLKERGKSKRKD